MNWILYGFKATGKTYFGRKLNLPFIDTDEWIQKKEGKTPREISLQKGEPYFRKLEREVILSLDVSQTVIAVGGGAILDKQNLMHLQTLGKMMYLRCSKEILRKRILSPPFPSFIHPNYPEESFENTYSLRKAIYEKICDIKIDLEGKTDREVLEELWQVIDSDKSLQLLPGENLTAKPLALS